MAELTRERAREILQEMRERGERKSIEEIYAFLDRHREELEKDSSLENFERLLKEERKT